MEAPPQYNPPVVATTSSASPVVFYSTLSPSTGGYVYNPPTLAVQPSYISTQLHHPAVYQHVPPLSQPAHMLYSPGVAQGGPYAAGAVGPTALTSSSSAVPGALPPSSRPSRPRAASSAIVTASSVPSPPSRVVVAASSAREEELCNAEGGGVVAVSIPNAEVVSDGVKKPFVVFEIVFQAGDAQHILLKRYSELRDIHDKVHDYCHGELKLARSPELCECALPEFPPAPWFTDHTKPEHKARRRNELLRYFRALVKEPRVLTLSRFHALMELDSEITEAMHNIGDCIVAKQMERKRIEHERKRQAEEERQRKMRVDYNHAQTFHRDNHFQVWCNGTQMTSTRALAYNQPMSFNLREKFWGFGDATIKGPNGQPWFQIMKTSNQFFHLHDCQYAIFNMQGEPLIQLQECWKFMSLKFKLYSFMKTDCTRQRQHLFKLCSIKRSSIFGLVEYVIKMAAPSTARDCRPCQKSLIKCEGSWGDWNTSFSVGGRVTANVGRNFAFMTAGDYDVKVMPGQDVILYLALAVCIDKMHHEATRK